MRYFKKTHDLNGNEYLCLTIDVIQSILFLNSKRLSLEIILGESREMKCYVLAVCLREHFDDKTIVYHPAQTYYSDQVENFKDKKKFYDTFELIKKSVSDLSCINTEQLKQVINWKEMKADDE